MIFNLLSLGLSGTILCLKIRNERRRRREARSHREPGMARHG